MDKTIVIIGFIQSLFGVLIFSAKKPSHLSFAFLTIWMAVIAIFLGAILLPFQVVDYFKPGIFPILFLTGPLLYFYVSSLAVENFKLKYIHLLHLTPFLLIVIHRSTIDVVSIGSTPDLTKNPSYLYNKVYYSLLVISTLFYWFLSLKVILLHRKNIPLYFSNFSRRNTLTWLVCVQSLFLLLFMTHFSMFFIKNVLGINISRFTSISLNYTFFAFIMIYFGINQSVIYKEEKEEKSQQKDEPEATGSETKYTGSSLDEKEVEEITEKIVQYLKDKKPYLNSEYSLQMMVDDLDISRNKLSQAINISQKKNFYKFINEFRIGEVKEKLTHPRYEHYTVLGIAFECGFNSKTSFNRIFKEETGFTPSEYKRKILSQNSN